MSDVAMPDVLAGVDRYRAVRRGAFIDLDLLDGGQWKTVWSLDANAVGAERLWRIWVYGEPCQGMCEHISCAYRVLLDDWIGRAGPVPA